MSVITHTPCQTLPSSHSRAHSTLLLCLLALSAACSEAPPCPSGSELQGEPPSEELLQALKEKGERRSGFESVCVIPGPHGPLKHGVYRAWYSDGETLKASITYEGGIKHGEYQLFYESGQLKEQGAYQYGLRQGRFSTFHRNGEVHEEGTYADGKRSGDITVTSDNGMHIQKGNYFMGQKHGRWSSEYIPLKGEPVTIKSFYHYGMVINEP